MGFVNHRMTVWTYWDKVAEWIDLIFSSNFCERDKMMHMDVVFTDWSVH